MHLVCESFTIRDWRTTDAPAVAAYANNPKIAACLRDAFPHPYTLADAQAFIDRAMAAEPPTLFAIATASEAIGGIGLLPGEDVHRLTAELGYWLAEPYWGRGIMTRAVKTLTDVALGEMGLVRVFAEPFATNPASARVLEKAGYLREGVMRANVVKNGVVLDQVLYSCVRDPGPRPFHDASGP